MHRMPDMEITCEDCKVAFPLTEAQQNYFTENGYTLPTRCEACEGKRKNERAAERASRKPKKKRRW